MALSDLSGGVENVPVQVDDDIDQRHILDFIVSDLILIFLWNCLKFELAI